MTGARLLITLGLGVVAGLMLNRGVPSELLWIVAILWLAIMVALPKKYPYDR
jgi:hypothetical protein